MKKIEKLNKSKTALDPLSNVGIFDCIKKYNYKNNQILSLSQLQIIGEGDYSIIVLHPIDNTKVIKIPKKGYENKIIYEYENHKKFYQMLKKIKNDSGNSEFDKFEIPEIYDFGLFGGYEMQRVDGQNIITKFYLDYYKEKLANYNQGFLNTLSDIEVQNILIDSGLDLVAQTQEEIEKLYFGSISLPLEQALLNYWNSGKIVKKLIQAFRKQGLKYLDIQPRNVMIGRNGKIYFIDFGLLL